MTNSKLNHEQLVAANHLDGPMLVLAGPGSGKTHLLVERIRILVEERSIPPDKILVITFSKKAALEMRQRFVRRVENKPYPVTFGTFHAVFYSILKQYNDYSKDSILTEKQKSDIVKAILSRQNKSSDSAFESSSESADVTEFVDNISAYKNFGDDFFAKSAGRYMTIEEQETFLAVYGKYCEKCRQMGKLDFDDMVLLVKELFERDENVLKQWQSRFRYFLVDEFQDINDAQYDVLKMLAGDCMNVFAVGDRR